MIDDYVLNVTTWGEPIGITPSKDQSHLMASEVKMCIKMAKEQTNWESCQAASQYGPICD